MKSLSKLTPVITRGRLENPNSDVFEKLLYTTLYNELRAHPDESSVIVSLPIHADEKFLSIISELLFEKHDSDSLHFATSAISVVASQNVENGIIVEIGDGLTQITPVFDFKTQENESQTIEFGGRDITEYLTRLVNSNERLFTTSEEIEEIYSMKERKCFLTQNYEKENEEYIFNGKQAKYILPDKTEFLLGRERYEAPELLFKPYLNGMDVPGIHHAILNSFQKCDTEKRSKIGEKIHLAGGTTKMEGLPERLEMEVNKLNQKSFQKFHNKKSKFLFEFFCKFS